jgi:HEAT repeat protein
LIHADDETAAILASALARMRTPDSLDALIERVSLPNVAARKAVVTALGAIGGPRAIDTLRDVAQADADPEVRRIAALASVQA